MTTAVATTATATAVAAIDTAATDTLLLLLLLLLLLQSVPFKIQTKNNHELWCKNEIGSRSSPL
jgi:hypothetical protein